MNIYAIKLHALIELEKLRLATHPFTAIYRYLLQFTNFLTNIVDH